MSAWTSLQSSSKLVFHCLICLASLGLQLRQSRQYCSYSERSISCLAFATSFSILCKQFFTIARSALCWSWNWSRISSTRPFMRFNWASRSFLFSSKWIAPSICWISGSIITLVIVLLMVLPAVPITRSKAAMAIAKHKIVLLMMLPACLQSISKQAE